MGFVVIVVVCSVGSELVVSKRGGDGEGKRSVRTIKV